MQATSRELRGVRLSKFLMASPLFILFLYTLPYFGGIVDIPMAVLFLLTPFISQMIPERFRTGFYFIVEMIFLFTILGLLVSGGQASAYGVYYNIISAEFAIPFIFGVEILRSRSPAAAMTSFVVGMGVALEEVATIAYSSAHSVGMLTAYVDVWSLQLQGILSLVENGYQSSLPFQTLSLPISPLILLIFIMAIAGLVLYLLNSSGEIDSVRIEQLASQLAIGSALTIAAMLAGIAFGAVGLSLAVVAASVLISFVVVARIARSTYKSQ